MEKLYSYSRALKLEVRDEAGERLHVSDKVELTHLRTELTWEGDAGVNEAVHEQGSSGVGGPCRRPPRRPCRRSSRR